MPAIPGDDPDQLNQSRKENKTMDYEQFKERIEEDLHQALADHGIDANFSQYHVEKLNASYDALSATPEDSHIGVNANLSAMFEAIENGQDYNEVVSRASESIIAGIENTPEINVEDLTNYDEMKSKLAMEVVSADRNAEMLENVPHEQMEDICVLMHLGSYIMHLSNAHIDI